MFEPTASKTLASKSLETIAQQTDETTERTPIHARLDSLLRHLLCQKLPQLWRVAIPIAS